MERSSHVQRATVAGWTTTFPEGMLLLFLHPIPRPYSHFTQLRLDACGYKPWLFWIGGGGLIAVGLTLLYWQPPGREPEGAFRFAPQCIVFGVLVLLHWLRMF